MKRSILIASTMWMTMVGVSTPALHAADTIQRIDFDDPDFLHACQVLVDPLYHRYWNCFEKVFAKTYHSGKFLSRAIFQNSDLSAAYFLSADLTSASFPCSLLTGTNFAGAKLGGAGFGGANMAGANFSGADLSGSVFYDAPCKDTFSTPTYLLGVNMSKAKLASSEFTASARASELIRIGRIPLGQFLLLEMRRANLAGASLKTVGFTEVDLRLSDFSGTNMYNVDFIGGDLACSAFTDVTWRRVGFKNTNLAGADFTGADLSGTTFTDAKLTGAIFARANLVGARLDSTDFTYADFTGAKLDGVTLDGVDLSGATWIDGTTICAQGSIGRCSADGPAMPPDPHALPGQSKGLAFLAGSIRGMTSPQITAEYLNCPYSTADYSDREWYRGHP